MLLTYHCTWKRQHLLSSQIYKFGVCFVRLPTSVSCEHTSKRCTNWIVWRNRNMRTGLHQPQPGLNYIRRNPICRLRLPGRSSLQLKAGGIGGDNQRKIITSRYSWGALTDDTELPPEESLVTPVLNAGS